jgi:transcriptional regulator with XRE-family HTH domain
VTLGNAIKLIRTARGRTQRDLAEALQVTANYLSLIEGDKREPSLAFLKRLAIALNVPLAMLFAFQGEAISGANNTDLEKLREILLTIDHMVVQNTTEKQDIG